MREEYHPVVANELVEINGPVCGLCLEIRSSGTETETVEGNRSQSRESRPPEDAGY